MTNNDVAPTQEYVLKRTGDRPVRFRGVCLVEEGTSTDRAASNYSGQVGRAETVRVYRTEGGSFVLAVQHHTLWEGETEVDRMESFATAEDLIEALPWSLGGPVLDAVMESLGEPVDTAEVVT